MREQAYNAFRYAYRVVFVANSTRRGWEPLNTNNNFATIQNGLDIERLRARCGPRDRKDARAQTQLSESTIAVVLLGTVCERKGQLDLLRALPMLPRAAVSRLRIFIVGDCGNDYSALLHAEADALVPELRARVAIVPQTNDPYLYLQAADISVFCSRLESYPRVILESMAFDLPIITTPVFGIAEQVENGVNALFYQPGDVAELALHLNRLISDDDLRRKFARNSRQVLQGLPDHGTMLDGYARLFSEGRRLR
jgi:glycosyltransferase involved in cell wall biosynthesis